MANERESKRWNDDQWVAAWPKRERLTEALTPHLLAAVGDDARSSRRVCDVGCGGGALTIALGGAVGSTGQVVGIDLSASLVELARDRATRAGAANVSFAVGDVQTEGLGSEPFDLAVSQLGVMFFDEPLVAFGAIRAGLHQGGRLVFACSASSFLLRPLIVSRSSDELLIFTSNSWMLPSAFCRRSRSVCNSL